MSTKCRFCDFEVEAEPYAPSQPSALTILTNSTEHQANPSQVVFGGLFGIYNQRTKETTWICGACLSEQLQFIGRPAQDADAPVMASTTEAEKQVR